MEPCTWSKSNQHSNSVTSNFLHLSSSRKNQHQGDLFHLISTNIPAHLGSVQRILTCNTPLNTQNWDVSWNLSLQTAQSILRL